MTNVKTRPSEAAIESSPRCCARCFGDRSFKAFIGRYGTEGEDCDFCGATSVRTLGIGAIAPRLWALADGYAVSTAGVHYIPELEGADGEPLDWLLVEDHPDLFASRLRPAQRQELVQAVIREVFADSIWEGNGAPSVSDLWVRPGSEIWAGSEDDLSFLPVPERWREFVNEISHSSRYFRLDPYLDPQSYLTPELLKRLARRLPSDSVIYRAVIGGVAVGGGLTPHPHDRMAGPLPEHSKEGLRVNAAGVPVLYAARDIATGIAEVRPWVGAPVSIATLRLERPVRLVDFSPRRRRHPKSAADTRGVDTTISIPRSELDAILDSIGIAMARPIDPADSQVSYAATQYVAELVRNSGFDGVMFKSAVGPGRNVVLFNRTDARVEGVVLHRVTAVRYRAEVAPPPLPPPPTAEELFGGGRHLGEEPF